MKKPKIKIFLFFTITLILSGGLLFASINDPAYHTVDEIYARMFALQDSLPDYCKVELIGYSQQDKIPIYALKINNDVNDTTSEDALQRPAVLFHDVHAEEVLGIEMSMWLIEKLIRRSDQYSRQWFKEVDTWFIPTSNPEGTNVVFSVEPSWRKNKRNNMQDGRFRYSPGWGGDTSGVDLARNFPLFWSHGDGFLKPGRNELYDYYRGPGPLSEAESQALDKFVDKYRPLFILTLHSSRTGNVAERVYYPWGRGYPAMGELSKSSPDIDAIKTLCDGMVKRTNKFGGGDQYLASPISTWAGEPDCYFYWKYGSISMRMEIGAAGPSGMQPDSAGIMEVIDGCHLGVEYLLNSAASVERTSSDEKGDIEQHRMDIRTFDSNGNPLQTWLDIPSLSSKMLPYRTTSAHTGTYHWLTLNGFTDTLTVRKFGYYTRRALVSASVGYCRKVEIIESPVDSLYINLMTSDSVLIDENVDLIIRQLSSPGYMGLGNIAGLGDPVPIEVPVDFPGVEFEYTVHNGRFGTELPEGAYCLTFLCEDKFVPRRIEIKLDSTVEKKVILSKAVALIEQNFDGGSILYTTDNIVNPYGVGADSLSRWELTSSMSHSGLSCLTDSRNISTIKNEDSWCAPYNLLDDNFDLSTAGTAALVYWLNQALEPGYDSMWVEVSIDGAAGIDPDDWTWIPVAPAHQEISILENIPERPWNAPIENLQQYAPWRRFVIPLDDYCGEPFFHFRFHIRSDSFIEEDGVYIDDILFLASDVQPPLVNSIALPPATFELDNPYPNPFNSRLTVGFNLSEDAKVKIALYDLSGRNVMNISERDYSTGAHQLSINAGQLPSGLYILKGESPFGLKMKKIMLIK
ncbi:T9SS type A sorting domain-containing protein [bacterium]|nr:T9SS type A sorting domain-containing protein [bacterium]